MPDDALPSFDLVVATLGRTTELDALLASLGRQTHRGFRVLLVDQNADDRLAAVLAAHPDVPVERLVSPVGLSRARNAALARATADVVAFPDDDCTYPPDLLERVGRELAGRPDLDGITGRASDAEGNTSERWPATRRSLDLRTVWHGGNSHTIFLRRALLEQVGGFDEEMGFGSGNPWELAEEIDVLVRALLAGARLEQDPSLVVTHVRRTREGEALRAYARSSGSGVGYVLGKNAVGARVLLRMAVRPLGGVLVRLARRDLEQARFNGDVLRWRVAGYRAARRAARSAKSSA